MQYRALLSMQSQKGIIILSKTAVMIWGGTILHIAITLEVSTFSYPRKVDKIIGNNYVNFVFIYGCLLT